MQKDDGIKLDKDETVLHIGSGLSANIRSHICPKLTISSL